jgi:hypothetical protein
MYFVALICFSVFFGGAISAALGGHPVFELPIIEAVVIGLTIFTTMLVRIDREFLVKSIPLRVLMAVAGCLGLAALFVEWRG